MFRRRSGAASCWSIQRSNSRTSSPGWPTAIYLLWYPVKSRRDPDALAQRLERLAIPKILRAEIALAAPRDGERLAACGLVMVNPPWTLQRELEVLLPALVAVLARDAKAAVRLGWLAGEK